MSKNCLFLRQATFETFQLRDAYDSASLSCFRRNINHSDFRRQRYGTSGPVLPNPYPSYGTSHLQLVLEKTKHKLARHQQNQGNRDIQKTVSTLNCYTRRPLSERSRSQRQDASVGLSEHAQTLVMALKQAHPDISKFDINLELDSGSSIGANMAKIKISSYNKDISPKSARDPRWYLCKTYSLWEFVANAKMTNKFYIRIKTSEFYDSTVNYAFESFPKLNMMHWPTTELPNLASRHPMFLLHQRLIDQVKETSYSDNRELAAFLINSAFPIADKNLGRSKLSSINVQVCSIMGQSNPPKLRRDDVLNFIHRYEAGVILPSNIGLLCYNTVTLHLSRFQYEFGFHHRKISNSIGTHRAHLAPKSNGVHRDYVEQNSTGSHRPLLALSFNDTHRDNVEPNSTGSHRAYIALGSNVGDRFNMIELACREMERRGIHIRRTSSLYETAAMYLHDQPPFINGACEVSRSSTGIKHGINSVHRC